MVEQQTLTSKREKRKQTNVARAALLVMFFLTVGKVVGVIDDLVKARVFGTSADLDAFVAAGGLPELLNVIIAGGALAAAFIPVLSSQLSRDDRSGATRLTSGVLNLSFLATALLATLVALFAPWLVRHIIASGFSPDQQTLTTGLMRVLLLSTVIFSLSGVAMSILHAHQHFLLPALAPIVYNLGIIMGAVFFASWWGVWGLAVGAVLGAAMHLLIQIPGLLRHQVRWRPVLSLNDPELRRVAQLMLPRVLTLIIVQLNILIAVRLASELSQGSVSALNFGWRVMQMPATVIGTAIAIAVFPTLSELAAQGRHSQLQSTLSGALRAVIVLSLPAMVGMIVLGRSIVQLLFQGGRFGSASTAAVLAALIGYAIGLLGHGGLEVGARGFFAHQNTRTPLLVAALGMVVSVLVGVSLRGAMGHAGLAVANSAGVVAEFVILLWFLHRALGGLDWRSLRQTFIRAAAAAAVMGLALVGLNAMWPFPVGSFFYQTLFLCASLTLGALVYVIVAWLLGVGEVRAVKRLLARGRLRVVAA